jgi:ATP-dependent RNA helicase RhlE
MSGKDVLGIAQTGSGKTASFVLPIVEQLKTQTETKNRFVSVLVLVPTRELAVQIAEVFTNLSKHLVRPLKTMAVYGGVSINPQMMSLRNTDILIATPGRLLDLIDHNAVHLSQVKHLVLDEADKMLNEGFKEEMNQILALLPQKRQTVLFSATLKDAIKEIKGLLLNNPVEIEIIPQENNIDLIRQIAYHVTEEQKGPFLRYLIKEQNMQQVLVFVASIKRADNLVVKLTKNGISAAAFHGDKSQGSRLDSLTKFKNGKMRVLVATDLAARGIDIQFLPHVINYELPRSPLDYVHRIGRTGRAESSGDAITLLCDDDLHHFKIIQKKMGKTVEIINQKELDVMKY